jgi:hypothetical protein
LIIVCPLTPAPSRREREMMEAGGVA